MVGHSLSAVGGAAAVSGSSWLTDRAAARLFLCLEANICHRAGGRTAPIPALTDAANTEC